MSSGNLKTSGLEMSKNGWGPKTNARNLNKCGRARRRSDPARNGHPKMNATGFESPRTISPAGPPYMERAARHPGGSPTPNSPSTGTGRPAGPCRGIAIDGPMSFHNQDPTSRSG
jgi:hypothetical protein